MKVSPYHGDAICSAVRLYTQLWEKEAEKHASPFRILVMGRDEGGGGISRGRAGLVFPLFRALSAATFCCLGDKPNCRTCCSAAYILDTYLEGNFDRRAVWELRVREQTTAVCFHTWHVSRWPCTDSSLRTASFWSAYPREFQLAMFRTALFKGLVFFEGMHIAFHATVCHWNNHMVRIYGHFGPTL